MKLDNSIIKYKTNHRLLQHNLKDSHSFSNSAAMTDQPSLSGRVRYVGDRTFMMAWVTS